MRGGKVCSVSGCSNGAISRSLCSRHSGGHRCRVSGCGRGAIGRTQRCSRHGGLPRCVVEGCLTAALAQADRCYRHGGGNICKVESCNAIAPKSSGVCARCAQRPVCITADCRRLAKGGPLCRGCSKSAVTEVVVAAADAGVSHTTLVPARPVCLWSPIQPAKKTKTSGRAVWVVSPTAWEADMTASHA